MFSAKKTLVVCIEFTYILCRIAPSPPFLFSFLCPSTSWHSCDLSGFYNNVCWARKKRWKNKKVPNEPRHLLLVVTLVWPGTTLHLDDNDWNNSNWHGSMKLYNQMISILKFPTGYVSIVLEWYHGSMAAWHFVWLSGCQLIHQNIKQSCYHASTP